jgi:TonB family protein
MKKEPKIVKSARQQQSVGTLGVILTKKMKKLIKMNRLNYFILLTIGIILSINVNSQNSDINNKNYYEFFQTVQGKEKLGTNWLRRNEVVPIIKEELDKYGFEGNFEYKLYSISSEKTIILDVYSRKENFGFVYKEGHFANPKPEHRNLTGYETAKYDNSGKLSFIKLDSLPKNIYVLREDWYWYQFENDKDEINNYVCKSKSIEILREDIKEILSKYKDLDLALEEMSWKPIVPRSTKSMFWVDNWAKFKNGDEGLENYLRQNKRYPDIAMKKKIEGTVIVEFEITEKGEVGEILVLQSQNKILDEEAIRLIKEMPNWKPAIQQGKPISVYYTQQIDFRL